MIKWVVVSNHDRLGAQLVAHRNEIRTYIHDTELDEP